MIKYAISPKYLDKDPFLGYRAKHEKKPITYLSWEELKAIEDWSPPSQKLSNVRDCFIFSCYTGLDYSSSKALRKHHLISYPDGSTWIEMTRKKTGKQIRVPLLPQATALLEKHMITPQDALPLYSNQKFNLYLKEIGATLGIKTKLTHHLARRTFATTVLLSRGVPIEVVKELLSHSDITTTMASYATVDKSLILSSLNEVILKN